MSDGVTFKISGGEKIAADLERKPPAIASQIIRHSLKAAVEPWRQQMIASVRKGWHTFSSGGAAKGLRAPRGGHGLGGREREWGVIARNINVSSTIGLGGFSGTASVFPNKRAFWARFLEKGFKHAGGKKVGPFAFIRPSFESRNQEVLDRYVEDVRKQLREGGLGT